MLLGAATARTWLPTGSPLLKIWRAGMMMLSSLSLTLPLMICRPLIASEATLLFTGARKARRVLLKNILVLGLWMLGRLLWLRRLLKLMILKRILRSNLRLRMSCKEAEGERKV